MNNFLARYDSNFNRVSQFEDHCIITDDLAKYFANGREAVTRPCYTEYLKGVDFYCDFKGANFSEYCTEAETIETIKKYINSDPYLRRCRIKLETAPAAIGFKLNIIIQGAPFEMITDAWTPHVVDSYHNGRELSTYDGGLNNYGLFIVKKLYLYAQSLQSYTLKNLKPIKQNFTFTVKLGSSATDPFTVHPSNGFYWLPRAYYHGEYTGTLDLSDLKIKKIDKHRFLTIVESCESLNVFDAWGRLPENFDELTREDLETTFKNLDRTVRPCNFYECTATVEAPDVVKFTENGTHVLSLEIDPRTSFFLMEAFMIVTIKMDKTGDTEAGFKYIFFQLPDDSGDFPRGRCDAMKSRCHGSNIIDLHNSEADFLKIINDLKEARENKGAGCEYNETLFIKYKNGAVSQSIKDRFLPEPLKNVPLDPDQIFLIEYWPHRSNNYSVYINPDTPTDVQNSIATSYLKKTEGEYWVLHNHTDLKAVKEY